MTDLTLWCIIENDTTSFSVTIPSSQTVDDLKKTIHAANTATFKNIDSKALILWKARIPIPRGRVNYQHYQPLVDAVVNDDNNWLNPDLLLSEAFTEVIAKTVQVIIQLPQQ
ncbi:hypothetical protein BGX26_007713, partial [Mortierella sp. AD094]